MAPPARPQGIYPQVASGATAPPPPPPPPEINESFGTLRPGEDLSSTVQDANNNFMQSMGLKAQVTEQEAAATLSRVRFNHKTGNPELVPIEAPGQVESSVTAEELANEHRRKTLSCFSNRDELLVEFGMPVIQYFNFVKFTVATNLIVFLITLIGFLPHLNNAGPKLYNEGIGFMQSTSISSVDLLFLSSVQPSSDPTWITMIALTVVVSFMAPFVYLSVATKYFKDFEKTQDMEELYNKSQADRIIRDKELDPSWAIYRLIFSYFIFILCLGAPMLIMWALLNPALYPVLQSQYDSTQKTPDNWTEGLQLVLYLLVSLTVTVSNLIFETVVGYLTDFEGHEHWHQYRNHRLWKRVIFRVSNMMALFAIRFWTDLPFYTCASGRIAFQVFIFIILDLTVNNIIEVLYPAIMDWVTYCTVGKVINAVGDEENRPEFELSDEYFEIVYRQYIMYMGVSVFPMIAGITLVANLVEWGTDKYRLFYHCRKPRQVVVGGRRHLFGALFISAFFALVTFPAGAVWWGGPLGPYMCWPCPQYSRFSSPDGSCGASFDEITCKMSNGTELSNDYMRTQIDNLRAPETSSAYRIADAFFSDNSGLFTSRRCACRPCLNVIGCGCNEPIHAFECQNVEPFIDGVENQQYWNIMQCDTPRWKYKKAEAATYQPKCHSGLGDRLDKDCTKHEDCPTDTDPKAFCKTYCPTPREGDDTFFGVASCWDCPEVATSSLVNPGQARTDRKSVV